MILFALILAVSLILQFFLPWWIIAPVAFGLAFWKSQSARQAFLAGFGAIFVLWIVAALIPDIQNNQILSTKIAELFFVKYPAILMAVTGIIGLGCRTCRLVGLLLEKSIECETPKIVFFL